MPRRFSRQLFLSHLEESVLLKKIIWCRGGMGEATDLSLGRGAKRRVEGEKGIVT